MVAAYRPDYRCMLVDASTGDNIDEVPLTISSYTYGLNSNPGQCVATLPLDDPTNVEEYWQGDRELTILRDDDPVWNGPLTQMPKSSKRGGVLNLVFREPSWYFIYKRVLEGVGSIDWTAVDIFDIFRDLFDDATTKTATGDDGMTVGADIIADLPRCSVAAGLAGITRSLSFSRTAGLKIGTCWDVLVNDADGNGLDYRVDYSTGSTRQSCHRTFVLGAPSLGVLHDLEITEDMLYDYSRALDYERAANRPHVRGGGGYWKVLQNSGQVTGGRILLEDVFDYTDESDPDAVDAYTREVRRVYQPPIHDRSFTFVPGDPNDAGATLPWGWISLGDVTPLNIQGPGALQITGQQRRAIGITVTPPGPTGANELVEVQTNLVIDELGD